MTIRETETYGKIGKHLKRALHKRHKSQRWLAEKLDVTPQHVNKWCNDSNKPNSSYLKKISNLLDYSVEEILTGRFRDEMKQVDRSVSEYQAIIEQEKDAIRSTIDVIANDPDLSDRQIRAYTNSIMGKIDTLLNIVSN